MMSHTHFNSMLLSSDLDFIILARIVSIQVSSICTCTFVKSCVVVLATCYTCSTDDNHAYIYITNYSHQK